MSQIKHVQEPFGEVNVYRTNANARVVATILMVPNKEGTQTGIAIDGSGSMKTVFGAGEDGGVLSSIFGGTPRLTNQVAPVAQKMCSYLADKLDADGGTTAIYWAVPPKGAGVQVIGDLTGEQAKTHPFNPPRSWGAETHLLPAVKYFVDRFADAPWGFYVFITDGELHDLEEVKTYTRQLSAEIAAGRRNPVKFVLIGIGSDVNEGQMEELDDLDTEVDLWDHKLAKEMRVLQEIFAECVDKHTKVADNGRILDPQGNVLKDYGDTGLPAILEFDVALDIPYFTLEVNGNRINQALFDDCQAPASDIVKPPEMARPIEPEAGPKDTEDKSWKDIKLKMKDA